MQAQQALSIHQVVSALDLNHSSSVAHRTGQGQYDDGSLHFKVTPLGVPSTVQPRSLVSNQTPADDYGQTPFFRHEKIPHGAEAGSEFDPHFQSPDDRLPGSVTADVGRWHIAEMPLVPDKIISRGFKFWHRSPSDGKKNNNIRRS